ncbi:MAG: DUF4194 domain-containing protein [Bacteroidota bacterium]
MTDTDLKNIPSYSKVLTHLLKGPLYAHDKDLWHQLLHHHRSIQQYFVALPLNLYVDEQEGYAFLKSLSDEEEEMWREERGEDPPRLISQRKLSYGHTLILVLLRKRLLEHDAQGGDTRLVIPKDEIRSMTQAFLPDETDQVRLTEYVERGINKMVDIGILRTLANDSEHVEVNRILKAKITPLELENIVENLKRHRL